MGEDAGELSKATRSRRFFHARVAVLLTILLCVLLYALRDVRRRRARNEWERPLDIAIVILRLEPVDDAAVTAVSQRADALGDRLNDELHRYRAKAPRPFAFRVVGPIDVATPPPVPEGEGPIDLAKHTFALSRYVKDVDARVALDPDAFDARIYVVARRPRNQNRTVVEGRSEQGGRVGVVEVELDREMADLTLFVVAHELMHTLGATDKYDATGHTSIPDGLAEPDRSPRFPQPLAEVMARNRPIAPGEERVPTSLDELGVGPITALEIGWR